MEHDVLRKMLMITLSLSALAAMGGTRGCP
jgi:hypothetical protein